MVRGSVVASVLLLLLAAGCVSRGSYQDVVAERDRLAEEHDELTERVRLLEASNASLAAERLRVLNELEDLRQEREDLEKRIGSLRRERAHLETTLSEREGKLAELAKLQGTYQALVQDLEEEVAAGQIQIEQLRDGLRLNVSDEILFPSGSAELSGNGRQVLQRVAAQLSKTSHQVEVQGHTDDVPISGDLARRYPSNWELAGARASRVVRLLEQEGVAPEQLTAVSFGQYHPVVPNENAEQRARNRRIEIRLIPVRVAGAEAPPAEAAGESR